MKPQRSARLTFVQATLALQALTAVFALVTLLGLSRAGQVDVGGAWLWLSGLALVLALGYAAGAQTKPWGLVVGSVLQVPMIAAWPVLPALGLTGVIFAVVWLTAVLLGTKIDRERAEFARAQEADAGADAREGAGDGPGEGA